VYDYGQIPDVLEKQSNGKLVANSPYLVMELGDDTLRTYCGKLNWASIDAVIMAILDALAHAHARGLIHRDLKPDNILYWRQQKIVKLTDFGLAHTMYERNISPEQPEIMGTPSYMAPEQFELRWRDYGPWTDLYALGCTIYGLLCGQPPFGRTERIEDIMNAHLYALIPPLITQIPVPPRFEDWLQCLMAKQPAHRFQRAADAFWALQEITHNWSADETHLKTAQFVEPDDHNQTDYLNAIGERVIVLSLMPSLHILQNLQKGDEQPIAPTMEFSPDTQCPNQPLIRVDLQDKAKFDALCQMPTMQFVGQRPVRSAAMEFGRELVSRFRLPPLMDDWRRPRDMQGQSLFIHDVGLGLYGLRSIPWVNREQERDQLWQALTQTHKAQKPFLVLLEGSEGYGKSRLAEWLCERAHEMGVGTPINIQFGPKADIDCGFDAAILHFVRGVGLSHQELVERLYLKTCCKLDLSLDECHALANWLIRKTNHAPVSITSTGQSPIDVKAPVNQAKDMDLGDIADLSLSDAYSDTYVATLEMPQIGTALWPELAICLEDAPVVDCTEPPQSRFSDWQFECQDELLPNEFYAMNRSDPSERYSLLWRFLHRLSQQRPVILWMDDIHWSLDAIHFAQYIIENQNNGSFPCLLLLTVQEETLAELRREEYQIAQLMQNPHTQKMHIGPLAPEYHSELVRELLGLQEDLATIVEERTAGNPQFAVQLIEDWVQRGLLEHTERGFCLAPNAEIALPDSVHQVWKARIDRILKAYPEDAGTALEIAAILGHEIEHREWVEVCTLANLPIPLDLLERLFDQRLLNSCSESHNKRWQFKHAMMRESLERRAKDGGRLQQYHALCAYMLDRKFKRDMLENPSHPIRRGLAERLGRHLMMAGQKKAALPHLLQGIREREEIGEYRLTDYLLREWEELLTDLKIPPEHPYWGEVWLLKSQIARGYSNYEHAFKMAEIAQRDARKYGWAETLSQSLLIMSHCASHCGYDEDKIHIWLLKAENQAQQLNKPILRAACRWAIGEFLCFRGQLSSADQYFRQSLEDYTLLQDHRGMGRALYGLAMVARQAERFEQAIQHLHLAQTYFENCGSQRGLAEALNALGDLHRLKGQLEQAEQLYRESMIRSRTIGAGGFAAICKLNLSLVLIHRKNYADAIQMLSHAIEIFARNSQKMHESAAHICILPCLAAEHDWEAWRQHISLARNLIAATGFHDVDTAEVAYLAGQIAEQSGAYTQALEAYHISLQQWEVLNNDAKISLLNEAITQLPPIEPS
jgi:tetratricopeptide (TPR) repeat protein